MKTAIQTSSKNSIWRIKSQKLSYKDFNNTVLYIIKKYGKSSYFSSSYVQNNLFL